MKYYILFNKNTWQVVTASGEDALSILSSSFDFYTEITEEFYLELMKIMFDKNK